MFSLSIFFESNPIIFTHLARLHGQAFFFWSFSYVLQVLMEQALLSDHFYVLSMFSWSTFLDSNPITFTHFVHLHRQAFFLIIFNRLVSFNGTSFFVRSLLRTLHVFTEYFFRNQSYHFYTIRTSSRIIFFLIIFMRFASFKWVKSFCPIIFTYLACFHGSFFFDKPITFIHLVGLHGQVFFSDYFLTFCKI